MNRTAKAVGAHTNKLQNVLDGRQRGRGVQHHAGLAAQILDLHKSAEPGVQSCKAVLPRTVNLSAVPKAPLQVLQNKMHRPMTSKVHHQRQDGAAAAEASRQQPAG